MDLAPPQLDALFEGYKVLTTVPDQGGSKTPPRKRPRTRT